ncbi:unnamed protein product [Periconia digitata]|uniref:Cytochrome P450 n=1 Tax=Periconia digitata TaxID=1303443 RepID=A0A9W4U5I1_9PLEO|nr:unnamed protein product [Periconia digitata]
MAIISSDLATVLALVIGAVALISYFGSIRVDAREPPVIQPRIPIIGHLIGLLRNGPLYFNQVRVRTKTDFFTLPILGSPNYVCGSPAISSAIQRTSSTLDLDHLVAQVSPLMIGLSKKGAEALRDPTARAEGRDIVHLNHGIINPPLLARNLESLTGKQLNYFSNFVSGLKNDQEFELYHMATRQVALASMDTFYGPNNPFNAEPTLIEDFFVWEDNLVNFMTLPSMFTRKATQALARMVKAYQNYLDNGLLKEAHTMFQNRQNLHVSAGMSVEDQARLEIGLAFGFNTNAGISMFWMLNHMFSRPELLAEIREEVAENAIIAPGTISYAKVKDHCPLLVSVFRETLRVSAPMTSGRWVKEDTVVADRYLLRKGSVVQILGGLLHNDPAVWGPDVDSFNPRRFLNSQPGLKTEGEGKTSSQPVHPAAFRSFGGGASMCPGRFFAQMELMTLAAVLVSGFELLPPRGRREVSWHPAKDETKFTLAACKPKTSVDVRLRRREGMDGVEWKLVP